MLDRCYNPKNKSYKYYGGKGVSVCDEWQFNFMSFFIWAIQGDYTDKLTLDRINSNGIYEPDNCRWATQQQQIENRSNTVYLEYAGERLTLSSMARKYGFPIQTLVRRIDSGWDLEIALTKPSNKGNATCKKGGNYVRK
jgi:hypothetical protein